MDNNAYEDNYWNDQGSGGVHGRADAYGDSGMSNEPAWAKEVNEPDYDNDPKYNNDDWQKDEEQPKEQPKKKESESNTKKSRWGRKKDDDMTVEKKECCNARLKRYMWIWVFFILLIAIGIVLMATNVILPGIIVCLIGLFGVFCAGWCFRTCGS